MKVARVLITPEFMADFLEFPDGSHIVGCRWDASERHIELLVEHPTFLDVKPDKAPTVEPMYTRPSLSGPAHFVSWNRKS